MVRGVIVGPRATEARRTETHIQKLTEEEKRERERERERNKGRYFQIDTVVNTEGERWNS